ncbi:unnamed protein product [Cuscuta campestris]|uniref:Transposase (putative) gypsy type domain-containing protein n=1 Tax=Cuscuta campestris TaxID=132261 RepID=A0A484MRV2_9ASTE|nr:unnamed protein product [Cuscuta campestris]
MACRFAFLFSVKNRRWTPSLPFAFFTTVRLQLRCSPDSFFFLSRSVPSLAAMIISDSDSATPSSNSRQAGQSASDRNPGHTPSPQPSPSDVPGHKRRRLRKQYPSSTPVDEGSRVKLDENIMALCHCQITDRGFADATDMVGPSIEVMRPTRTQTALDAPSGFFTVHLASLKKGLRFPLHSLLMEFLNVVDLLPYQLVPNSHRYIAGYLVRCKDVGVKPTLDHFIFTFKLTKGHKDWASYASLSQRSSKLFASDKKGSTKDWKPFFVFVATGPESPFTGSGRPSFRHIPRPPPDATLLSITRQFCNKGVMNIKEVVTEETLAGLGFEFVQDELRHQPDLLRDILEEGHVLGKTYSNKDLVRKILRSLTPEWRSKADAIYESIGNTNVTIDGLRASSSKRVEVSDSDSDDHIPSYNLLEKFQEFLKEELGSRDCKRKGEPVLTCFGCGELSHIKPYCPNRKEKKKNERAYMAWDSECSGDETATLCLMAHERNGEVLIMLNRHDQVEHLIYKAKNEDKRKS